MFDIVTGTTASSIGTVSGANYPSGYDMGNTWVAGFVLQYNNSTHYIADKDIQIILQQYQIGVSVTNSAFLSKPFKLLLAKKS